MENKSGRTDPTQKKSSILFADFQNLQRIWTHPMVLRYNSERYEIVQQKKVKRSFSIFFILGEYLNNRARTEGHEKW